MKSKITIFFLFLIGFSIPCSAGFPVTRTTTYESHELTNTKLSETISSPAAKSQKSQGVALILVLTLGLLAAHRWYLGYPWLINIGFIFTLGGFGVWLLIDLIGIITGSLGPFNGRYKKSFF